MRDGRPNPDIWGNIITCGEIAVGIYEIVGSKKRGLEIPKAVAEEILPESVMEQATQDGEALCFTDPVSNAIVADALLEHQRCRAGWAGPGKVGGFHENPGF